MTNTEAGGTVLIIHHPRKGDAAEGQACRGSGSLPGFVDVIVELRRFQPDMSDDPRRNINRISRFDETPKEIVVELDATGYRVVGSRAGDWPKSGGDARNAVAADDDGHRSSRST